MTNLNHLSAHDEVKFVIADRADFEWACEIINRYSLVQHVNAVLMGPVFGSLAPSDLADWILRERLTVRLQLQLHKQIWSPSMRGV